MVRTRRRRDRSGFTLIELMIVVGVIAVVASIALPILPGARMNANESAAISTLRSLASAQAQASVAVSIDADVDGAGEYGYLAELSGGSATRTDTGVDGPPLTLPFLSSSFQNVQNRVVRKGGYRFQVWLPDAGGLGVPEAPTGGADPNAMPDPNGAEVVWCAYAWPDRYGVTGNRAFFSNQDGDILQTTNTQMQYGGAANAPAADAAFASTVPDGLITGPTAVGGPSKDGQSWSVVQ